MVKHVDEIELKVLAALRRNARTSLLALARKLNIPSSTIHQKMHRHEGNIVIKHTTLLDFNKLGYFRALFAIKTTPGVRDAVQAYLESHWGVNNVHKIDSGYDFLAEYVGKDQKEIEDFTDAVKCRPGVMEVLRFTIIRDIAREIFGVER